MALVVNATFAIIFALVIPLATRLALRDVGIGSVIAITFGAIGICGAPILHALEFIVAHKLTLRSRWAVFIIQAQALFGAFVIFVALELGISCVEILAIRLRITPIFRLVLVGNARECQDLAIAKRLGLINRVRIPVLLHGHPEVTLLTPVLTPRVLDNPISLHGRSVRHGP
jgi:hypothetical protein